jgi:hypothetical protein
MSIDMPNYPAFTTCRFGLETNTQIFTSPLTKATQRMLLGGARWIATYSLPAMNKSQQGNWAGFFLSLQGGVNSFNAYDPDRKTPLANLSGSTPLVNGGSQTGTSLITDGWPASITVLKAGERFSVNGELKMVTSDAVTNGSGQVTISFMPALRNSPADNAAITVQKPTCTMVLSDDMQAIWECNPKGIYQPKTFSAFEVFS